MACKHSRFRGNITEGTELRAAVHPKETVPEIALGFHQRKIL